MGNDLIDQALSETGPCAKALDLVLMSIQGGIHSNRVRMRGWISRKTGEEIGSLGSFFLSLSLGRGREQRMAEGSGLGHRQDELPVMGMGWVLEKKREEMP